MPYSIVPSYNTHKWKEPSGSINKLNQTMIFETKNIYGFPELSRYNGKIPKDLINYHDSRVKRGGEKIKDNFVHFNIDDYYFENMWSRPNKLLSIAKRFAGFLSTTYSIYAEQPKL